MMKSEVDNSRLRDVVDFEVDYIRRSLEHELSKKDELISQKNLEISKMDRELSKMDCELSRKDQEIELLKAKLRENGIK
ncbi:MAG: hypothetical protein J6P09_00625 [Methanobrevibacter sp.]|nr:hypothetical protein [Methanobrevibacter sp.]